MVHKKHTDKYNTIRDNLDSIVNSTKKIAAGTAAVGILGTGVAAAQQANPDSAMVRPEFTNNTPYRIIKPGSRHDFSAMQDPNGITYFLVRADFDGTMSDLINGKMSINYEDAQKAYWLMKDIKRSSIFDKIGTPDKVDGERLSRSIAMQLGNVERINTDSAIVYRKGIWNEKETEAIGKMVKSMGYDKMWAIIQKTTEGYTTNQTYERDDGIMFVLIDTEDYMDIPKRVRAARDKIKDAKPETVDTTLLGFYVGVGADYIKYLEHTIPQGEIGLELGKFSLGINGGYDSYMKNFVKTFNNGQGNGSTVFNTDANTKITQYGAKASFDITKNVALCLGAQNNIIKSDSTGTFEQTNINPFTGEIRYLKGQQEPKNIVKKYWTLDPGIELKFGRFGIYGAANFDPHEGKIVGGQAAFRIHLGEKYRR